jgi:hypothetical protein
MARPGAIAGASTSATISIPTSSKLYFADFHRLLLAPTQDTMVASSCTAFPALPGRPTTIPRPTTASKPTWKPLRTTRRPPTTTCRRCCSIAGAPAATWIPTAWRWRKNNSNSTPTNCSSPIPIPPTTTPRRSAMRGTTWAVRRTAARLPGHAGGRRQDRPGAQLQQALPRLGRRSDRQLRRGQPAFTKPGWDFMKAALKNPGKYFEGRSLGARPAEHHRHRSHQAGAAVGKACTTAITSRNGAIT